MGYQSKRLAKRVEREAGKNTTAQIERAWLLCLGRSPDADEARAADDLVREHGLPALGRVLFNSGEFVVIE